MYDNESLRDWKLTLNASQSSDSSNKNDKFINIEKRTL